ncbi:ATP-binding protein [Clostridium acetireducens]|nr:ATP-binding protein [Clostridium acetireducens]
MANYSKVIIDKNFLKRHLVEKEDISKFLSRFIDNSIKARQEVTTSENPCHININIFENLIIISDNSGGININITDKEIFRIGINDGKRISGLGIKKSLFKLGNKIEMLSNKKGCSRKFSLDINIGSDELKSQSENIDYNPERQCHKAMIQYFYKILNHSFMTLTWMLKRTVLYLSQRKNKKHIFNEI